MNLHCRMKTIKLLSWGEKGEAGSDWLAGFMKRNETVSVQNPEATSIGCEIGFNRVSIGRFFVNLEAHLDKGNKLLLIIDHHDIQNVKLEVVNLATGSGIVILTTSTL
ncbi:hypothetical protein LSAT2_030678 [Lamellibrachia satsuma]|nr:hypothetical protein LSAT2_030678 [Lamellibrachia satsuma]